MLDLFGEVPITHDDIARWCEAVAGIPPDSPRFARYVRGYRVVDKVRAAKLAGTFDAILEERPRVPARLAAAFSTSSAAPSILRAR